MAGEMNFRVTRWLNKVLTVDSTASMSVNSTDGGPPHLPTSPRDDGADRANGRSSHLKFMSQIVTFMSQIVTFMSQIVTFMSQIVRSSPPWACSPGILAISSKSNSWGL
eukprot:2355691-Pyramimonas_sp.AAC.2